MKIIFAFFGLNFCRSSCLCFSTKRFADWTSITRRGERTMRWITRAATTRKSFLASTRLSRGNLEDFNSMVPGYLTPNSFTMSTTKFSNLTRRIVARDFCSRTTCLWVPKSLLCCWRKKELSLCYATSEQIFNSVNPSILRPLVTSLTKDFFSQVKSTDFHLSPDNDYLLIRTEQKQVRVKNW